MHVASKVIRPLKAEVVVESNDDHVRAQQPNSKDSDLFETISVVDLSLEEHFPIQVGELRL